ncbi:uncharacterized protein LOC126973223 [Leptidea sinapis]|uniref:uncharacterized protein LOC126973223 n=1 Tax=Leptidea sinapis TaxID=189913 RepID=UPI0021C446B1|nr:uncharacterized protein LOC126973223 [Leptidea sinapis]
MKDLNELTGDTKELEEKATTKGFDRYYEEDWLTDRKAERFKDEHNVLPKTTEGLDEVVFIPNDKEDAKGETNLRNIMKGDDSIVGLMNEVEVETESPKEDIIFLSGKNDDVVHRIEEKQPENDKEHTTKKPKVVLDCKDLNCNNNKASVCGGKEEEHKWKFRLFLNDCYFRKVNCAFKYEYNSKYLFASLATITCSQMLFVILSAPYFEFQPPRSRPQEQIHNQLNETRRMFSSRRSLSFGIDGQFCAHACPISCTEDYDPQCAVSSSGHRQVFLNHCKLDYNSCLNRIVWRRQPLSKCIGGKKADMRQNRGFIGWLQRVGIVDKKGRLAGA